MLLETAIEIEFECLQPVGKLVADDRGIYSFVKKPKFRKRRLEFAALTDFLRVPDLSKIGKEEREFARSDFYMRWGFLAPSHDYATLSEGSAVWSENEASFDKFQKELINLNKQRLNGQLKDTHDFKLTVPDLMVWGVHEYEGIALPLPKYCPKNLMNALYLMWFFGARELSGMRTCKRFATDGAKSGCQVFFKPSRKDQDYCGKPCAKAFHEKRRPKRKRI